MSGEARVRYDTLVHARNRAAEYGLPVTVYASSRREAVDRAIEVGWSGRASDARVYIKSAVEESSDD